MQQFYNKTTKTKLEAHGDDFPCSNLSPTKTPLLFQTTLKIEVIFASANLSFI